MKRKPFFCITATAILYACCSLVVMLWILPWIP